jgi:predicted PurR-regulated permease PerM
LKFLLASAAVVIIFAGLQAAQIIIAPLLLAIFFALILTPPLAWLKKKGLPDALAIIVLSAFVFLLGLGGVLIFSNALTQFAKKLPTYQEKVTVGYTTIDTWINTVADKMEGLGKSITQLNPLGNEESEPLSENCEEEIRRQTADGSRDSTTVL